MSTGLASDGGLYLPDRLDPLPRPALWDLHGAPFDRAAAIVARHLLQGDVPDDRLDRLIRDACDFPIPLVRLTDRIHALELFHGPTLSFKDVGARFMAGLMKFYDDQRRDPRTVLVATSGDTGGAVAHAFLGAPRARVVILYPQGGVSPLQERQFTTLGDNITALAVEGTFDDCQRLVKEAFAHPRLEPLRLTSANSINIGRLLPQIFYYFHAWGQLPDPPERLIVSVPSGNFGNLTAGLMAKRMGLPVTRFVAATNVNDVVPAYLATGSFHPRASVRTISNAMDVGNPSNFARMAALYEGDARRMHADVEGSAHTDDATRGAITAAYRRFGYVLDPHSAVAYLGLEQALHHAPDALGVFLATAHPAKFADVVEPLIEKRVPMPERLAAVSSGDPAVRHVGGTLKDLEGVLLAL